MTELTILTSGSAVVTDLGRTAGPRYGLPVNGALDQFSARIANVLVKNADNSPLIEITALDFAFRTDTDILVAVTGAIVTVTVDDQPQPQWEPVSVRAGSVVHVGGFRVGLRAYVAVHGGLSVPSLLGSVAPDSVLEFGARLAAGATLPLRSAVRPISNPYFSAALYNLHVAIPQMRDDIVTVDVTDGPDIEEFGQSASRLFAAPFTVTPHSNHIGLRMTGDLPLRQSTGEFLSRGVAVGSVEVPPGHELLVLHRGRGVTAGYPVLAVATATSLDRLAQVRPGQRVRFRRCSVEEAIASVRAQRTHITDLRQRVDSVFDALGTELERSDTEEEYV